MKRIIVSTALAVLIIGLLWLVHSRSTVALDEGTYLIEGVATCEDLGALFGFK